MKYLLAISGGIDSVVLLDMLVADGQHELIVAHFDHGIRDDSSADARFVEALAKRYNLPFVCQREELGKGASEDLARKRRYTFLRSEAKKHQATIVTAHHADDSIETIAINIIRGTGWRGVAVLDTSDIVRPLLNLTKEKIRLYARSKRLEWVEDSTNAETEYFRNRVRRAIAYMLSDQTRQTLLELWKKQVELKGEIDDEERQYLTKNNEYSRYFFIQLDSASAQEIVRAAIFKVGGSSPLRSQVERTLLAIKTAQPSTLFEVGGGVSLYFTVHTFIVQTP